MSENPSHRSLFGLIWSARATAALRVWLHMLFMHGSRVNVHECIAASDTIASVSVRLPLWVICTPHGRPPPPWVSGEHHRRGGNQPRWSLVHLDVWVVHRSHKDFTQNHQTPETQTKRVFLSGFLVPDHQDEKTLPRGWTPPPTDQAVAKKTQIISCSTHFKSQQADLDSAGSFQNPDLVLVKVSFRLFLQAFC